MRFLRSNTAVIVTVGPFYDKTDGVTIETALTITNERITLTADTDAGSAPTNILDNITGATAATANDLNYITGNDAGMMQLELASADVNRVGRMFLSITDAANHVPVFHEFFVLPQAIFDWFTGVIVPLPANVTQLLGTAWLTPGTAGTPDVNTKLVGGTAQTAGDIIGDTNDLQARLPAVLTGAGNLKVDVLAWVGVAPNALITGRVDVNAQVVGDKTGYALGAGGFGTTAAAANAFTAAAFDPDVGNEFADSLLARNVSGGSSTGRLVKQAFHLLRNLRDANTVPGTLTVYDTDDSTVSWTAALTTAAGNPLTKVDPA